MEALPAAVRHRSVQLCCCPGPASQTVRSRLQHYREARKMIVEDPEIQRGVPTFKGTRIPVHQIATLLLQGVPDKELREDYPNLTSAMIEAALIYGQAHPRRGRPHNPRSIPHLPFTFWSPPLSSGTDGTTSCKTPSVSPTKCAGTRTLVSSRFSLLGEPTQWTRKQHSGS
jgi:uncharacterized protein (DUF433 family)